MGQASRPMTAQASALATRAALMGGALIALLAGCASGLSNVMVPLAPYAAAPSAPDRSGAAHAALTLEPVRDARRELVGSLVGERTTLGNISMGLIETIPPPVTVMSSLLQAELTGLGFGLAGAGSTLRAAPRLVRFEVRTPATALYWDIEGNVALELGITRAGAFAHAALYEAQCSDRTYAWPGETLIAQVLSACLKDLGAKLRADGELARLAASP